MLKDSPEPEMLRLDYRRQRVLKTFCKIIEDEELLSRHHIPANFLRLRVLNEVPFQVPTAFTYKLQRPKCLILKILANFLKLECTVCKKKTELLHLKKGD